MNAPTIKLTSLAHGGGCGCKLAPALLQQLISQPAATPFLNLLVGTETSDDAAVWKIDDNTCIVATTDFFLPVVDDPADFGRVAAANAISDVYAMGAKPLMALAILGMPVNKISVDLIRQILNGGASICSEAEIPVAGGHSIDAPEPIYGLVVVGTCRPDQIRRNSGARAGDCLILTKPIGVGVYSAAIRKGILDGPSYGEMIGTMTLLNKAGMAAGNNPSVHAMTDVTGFGLLGHSNEIAQASKMKLNIQVGRIPFLKRAEEFAANGIVTGASKRNWESYGRSVQVLTDLPEWRLDLLTDPQTSGGLLIACAPDSAAALTVELVASGNRSAAVIGTVEEGDTGVCLTI